MRYLTINANTAQVLHYLFAPNMIDPPREILNCSTRYVLLQFKRGDRNKGAETKRQK